MKQETSKVSYDIVFNASPNEADMAITSIDAYGNPGKLNVLVLSAYGYDQEVLSQLDLEKGYDLLEQKGKKAILFIVTYGKEYNNESSLRNYLTYAIKQYQDRLSSKSVWIPLLGTGESGISFSKSLEIIQFVIEGFILDFNQSNTQFIISISDSPRGTSLYSQLRDNLQGVLKKGASEKKGKKASSKLFKKEDSTTKSTITTVTKINTIAGLVSDADLSTDHLNIAKDVSAFARVVAAKSFMPPLAIALFGKWGSGKSFFMKKLKERIKLLSIKNPEGGFCEGIAHVHFNAWSYMDANLWAGIITKIFDGLNQYIQNNSAGDQYKNEIERVLTHKLNITHSELEELEKKKGVIDAQLESLYKEKNSIEKRLQKKIQKIENSSMLQILTQVDKEFKAQQTVENAIANNITMIQNQEQFAQIVPREYWKTPDELYTQTKSTFTFLKTFFKAGKWQANLVWLIGILAIIIAVPYLLKYIATVTQWSDLSIPPNLWYGISVAGALYIRGQRTYKQLQPLVACFWKIKKDYELKKEDALFGFRQQEKALTLEIEQIKSQIVDLNQQINQTTEQRAEIEFRLKNTISTEALHSFIEKRSTSKEYEKHLGLISIIRKDFEILSHLFTDHHKELQNAEETLEAKKFRENFDRPLERIILYIDDLDRCPEERVVEVLEAVNLLMAYPLFVVVVGVDPRWIKNALIKKHQMHFVKSLQDAEMETIDPSSYLEKIFQVPFNLKAANDESLKHMLKTLASTKPIYKETEEHTAKDDVGGTTDVSLESKKETGKNKPGLSSRNDEQLTEEEQDVIETKETLASLELSEKEIELLQEMSLIIGPSPRAIKRFINIYRIIKAHEDFGYEDQNDPAEIRAVLLLLALPIGKFKKLNQWFENYINQSPDQNRIFDAFKTDIIQNLDEELRPLSTEFEAVLNQDMKELCNQKIILFKQHLPFINRFTYNGD